jgi:hypothetical protein
MKTDDTMNDSDPLERRPVSVPLTTVSSKELLEEVGRRFSLRFGRIEITYHAGKPAPKVTVEHRVHCVTDEG